MSERGSLAHSLFVAEDPELVVELAELLSPEGLAAGLSEPLLDSADLAGPFELPLPA